MGAIIIIIINNIYIMRNLFTLDIHNQNTFLVCLLNKVSRQNYRLRIKEKNPIYLN